jgi:hypothetical protein
MGDVVIKQFISCLTKPFLWFESCGSEVIGGDSSAVQEIVLRHEVHISNHSMIQSRQRTLTTEVRDGM